MRTKQREWRSTFWPYLVAVELTDFEVQICVTELHNHRDLARKQPPDSVTRGYIWEQHKFSPNAIVSTETPIDESDSLMDIQLRYEEKDS